MGAFDIGFSQGSQAGAGDLARSRQLQDEQRQQNLQRNWGILNDPSATPELKQTAGQDIQNQYPTPAHKGTFLSDILNIHAKNQAAQAQPNPAGDAGAVPTSAVPPPPTPTSSAKDGLGVPFDFGSSAPATPPPGAPSSMAAVPVPSAGPSATPTPSASLSNPNLAAVGAASTPQAAMSLWQQYRGPVAINEDIAQQRAKAAAGYAQNLEAQRAQANIELAKTRAQFGVGVTPENRYLQQYAQQHGYGYAGDMNADEMADAMRGYKSANVTPGWKSVTDGNNVYAIDSHNPNGQRTLIGHKDDLTQRQEFRTMTNPDGSTFLVPVTVWSKKGSSTPVMETQDDQGGAAPVSANTPQGPPGANPSIGGAPSPKSGSGQSSPQGTNPNFITQSYQQKSFPGLVSPGNLDITQRPNIDNGDGTHSSTFSMSFGTDKGEVLVPGVGDGTTYPLRKLTTAETLDQYKKTGKNFGTFATPEAANTYATQLHNDQQKYGNTGSGATPISANTPSGPSNPGARQPGTQPAGSAVKAAPTRIPSSSVGAPIPFGGKPSELTKSDTSQYTKLAEDANDKQKTYESARQASMAPTPASDQGLIFSWVRSNVQGAGRMTQAEFKAAGGIGSVPTRLENWISMAESGKLTPQMRQMMLADVQRSAQISQASADSARNQVQQDIGQNPKSNKTPSAPGAWTAPKDAPAPTKPNQVLKANGQVVARSVDGKTWSQP